MYNFIIILSILFFALSGAITYKALEIPVYRSSFQNIPKESKSEIITHERKEVLNQLSEEQAANRALVEELKATIVKLEDEISNKNEEMQENIEFIKPKKQTGILAVLGAGTFKSGQIAVNTDLGKTFEELARNISASPEKHVIIEGHTDNIPINLSLGRLYINNMELSFLRAKAVASLLVKNGISIERISVKGYGDTRPIASNDTDEGRAKNRRVEVKLIPEDKEF